MIGKTVVFTDQEQKQRTGRIHDKVSISVKKKVADNFIQYLRNDAYMIIDNDDLSVHVVFPQYIISAIAKPNTPEVEKAEKAKKKAKKVEEKSAADKQG